MLLCYPRAPRVDAAVSLAWWRQFDGLPDDSVRLSFRRAQREHQDPQSPPSCEFVRRIAERDSKLTRPKADLSLPALPEPELRLPQDNPFYEKLEAYKRGEIPCREKARAEAAGICAAVAGGKGLG
jgi:hypothetical protein